MFAARIRRRPELWMHARWRAELLSRGLTFAYQNIAAGNLLLGLTRPRRADSLKKACLSRHAVSDDWQPKPLRHAHALDLVCGRQW